MNAPSSVVDDVLDDTSDVTVPLGKVESSESRRLLSVVRVGLETENEGNSDGARGRKKGSAHPSHPRIVSLASSPLPSRTGSVVLTLKIPPDFLWFKMTRCEEKRVKGRASAAGLRGRRRPGVSSSDRYALPWLIPRAEAGSKRKARVSSCSCAMGQAPWDASELV